MLLSSCYTRRNPGPEQGTDSLSWHAHSDPGSPVQGPQPLAPSACPAGLAHQPGEQPPAQGRLRRMSPGPWGRLSGRSPSPPASRLLPCRAGFPSELNSKGKHSSAPSGHAGSWRKGGCSFPEQRGSVCLQRPGLRRRGGTEPPVLGTDSAALTSFSCSWFIIYRAGGGRQLPGRWDVQGGSQGSVPSCPPPGSQGGDQEGMRVCVCARACVCVFARVRESEGSLRKV